MPTNNDLSRRLDALQREVDRLTAFHPRKGSAKAARLAAEAQRAGAVSPEVQGFVRKEVGAALTEAREYTDSEFESVPVYASEAYVDAGDATTLASAQSYADTAEADAIAAAATDATNKADTAYANARTFAMDEDADLQTALEAYADAAEAAAISAAASDATTKANAAQAAAEATASSDATAKANAAQTAAQSFATSADSTLETSLQSYADAAEADAISTAAADATTKADAAEAAAIADAVGKYLALTLGAPATVTQAGNTLTFQTNTQNAAYFLSSGGVLCTGTLFGLAGNQRGIYCANGGEVDFTSAEPSSPPTNSHLYLHTGSTGTGSITTGQTFTANRIYRWDGATWQEVTPRAGDVFHNTTNGVKRRFSGSAWSLPLVDTVESATAPSDTAVKWKRISDGLEFVYDSSRSKWLAPSEFYLEFSRPGAHTGSHALIMAGNLATSSSAPQGVIAVDDLTVVGWAFGCDTATTPNGWTHRIGRYDDSAGTGTDLHHSVTQVGSYNEFRETDLNLDFDALDRITVVHSLGGGSGTMTDPHVTLVCRRRG